MTAMSANLFDKRVLELNTAPVDRGSECVVYWMQRSQRAVDNPALAFATELANGLGKPLVVYFGLFDGYPMASVRAFKFMLEGLKETARMLQDRGIGFVMRREHPMDGLVRAAKEFRACAVVADEDYTNMGREWRAHAAKQLAVRLYQVDAETVVPARITDHEEWAAYTLRPKILKALDECLIDAPEPAVERMWNTQIDDCIDMANCDPLALANSLRVDQNVPPVPGTIGGLTEARERLARFVEHGLPRYAAESKEIGVDVTSNLSPYLHFGQIASKRVALAVRESDAPDECVDAFLEQVVVRRELAINFCLHNPNYASIDAAPDWARKTLAAHALDPRPELYSLEELESASTHDDLWNAAQAELCAQGKIHGYMRMVWAKKILEWSPAPEEALARAIYLNDKYALDGRDPNGYTNIAWCILGKHDRPFANRPIFGKVRYMSTESTKRKTRWREYVARTTSCRT